MNTERFTFGGVTLEVRGQDAWTVSKASARFHAEDGAETNHVISVEYSPTPPPVPDHAVKNGPVSRWREGEALHTLRVCGAVFVCRAHAGANAPCVRRRLPQHHVFTGNT